MGASSPRKILILRSHLQSSKNASKMHFSEVVVVIKSVCVVLVVCFLTFSSTDSAYTKALGHYFITFSNWRAGASQPSRTSGSDFSIYIGIWVYILGECMALLASGSDPTA